MMSVELLQTLSLVLYIAAGVLVLVAIALFFLLDIKKVIGDITGANARKAINMIREQNEVSGDKAYKQSLANAGRGKFTDKISPSGRLQRQIAEIDGSPGMKKINTTKLIPFVKETTVLNSAANETTVLKQSTGNGGTAVPSKKFEVQQQKTKETDDDCKHYFSTDVEMSFTGSSEIIE